MYVANIPATDSHLDLGADVVGWTPGYDVDFYMYMRRGPVPSTESVCISVERTRIHRTFIEMYCGEGASAAAVQILRSGGPRARRDEGDCVVVDFEDGL